MTSEARSEEPVQNGWEGERGFSVKRYASILAGYVDSLNAGESPDVVRLLNDHPDLAADLRQDIKMLSRLRRTVRSYPD